MKASTKILLLGIGCFTLVVLFEAAQQQYYITRFQLANEEVSFFDLLKNHAFRWLIWVVFGLALYRFTLKRPIHQSSFDLKLIGQYAIVVITLLLLAICTISLMMQWANGDGFDQFFEYFQFYIYQKAALFTSAYLGLIILIHLYLHQQELELKIVELSSLKKENKQLYQELKSQSIQDHSPLIHIKIGNKLKAIPLSEIYWIQSEDYCVRVHTKNGQSYLLRKSMKAMERELMAKGFIRIHRNAIVNITEVDSFLFQDEPTVVLKQGETLKIANSRVAQIKEVLKMKP